MRWCLSLDYLLQRIPSLSGRVQQFVDHVQLRISAARASFHSVDGGSVFLFTVVLLAGFGSEKGVG